MFKVCDCEGTKKDEGALLTLLFIPIHWHFYIMKQKLPHV